MHFRSRTWVWHSDVHIVVISNMNVRKVSLKSTPELVPENVPKSSLDILKAQTRSLGNVVQPSFLTLESRNPELHDIRFAQEGDGCR